MVKLNPRWKKVLRDLFANRTRTMLVVLSIAVGVFAVGAVQSSQNILTREMNRTWNSTRPASARLSLSAFEQDFVESIQRMPEIVAAEGRRSAWARTTSGQETKQIELVGIRDFDDIHVGAIFPEQVSPGTWPPPKRQILLERNSLAFLGVAIGDMIDIELNSKRYKLQVAGTAYNPDEPGPTFLQNAAGFVTLDTMEWLGQSRQFDRLLIIAVVGGLGLAGTMSINVLERTREIGVMRAIGASNGSVRQIVVVERVLIGVLSGLIGAALAVPISILLSNAIGTMLLRDPLFYTFGWLGLAIWFGLVILIATLASVLPAMRAARLTVREVLAYA